jgi:hypothetical protein
MQDVERTETGPDAGETPSPADVIKSCPLARIPRTQELLDNLPYLVMLVLGALLVQRGISHAAGSWLAAGLYFAYGVGGALWIMLFVCPYCHFYDTRLCPCGYGQIAAKLRARQDGADFRQQFRRHIPVIVPLWFLPLIAGGLALTRQFSWLDLALLLAFALNSFVVLPLVSRLYGCAKCPQKESCPWMGGCKRA